MIEKYYLKPQTVDRIRANWLGEPVENYVAWLHDQGFAARTIHRRVPILFRFGAYAKSKGAASWCDLPNFVSGFVDAWLHERVDKNHTKLARRKIANEVRNPIERMLKLLLPSFAITTRGRPFPFLDQAPDFQAHLRNERGIRPNSVLIYRHCLRPLEVYLNQIRVKSLAELSPTILSAFTRSRREHWGVGMIGTLCGVLRVFLRYLYREKIVSQDFSQSIEGPRQYRLSTIPRSISWLEVGQMLSVVDRRSAVGKRDYAILVLLVTYGLRGREIAALTLNDVDWDRERLRIPERKGGHSTAYPLSAVVGEAIIDYLKHGRPTNAGQPVFYRTMAPWSPLTASGISCRASYYLRKAGVIVHRGGSHTLRHTCVQRLIDAHFSLKTIGDYVGHASPESTAVYAKVSIENLREIALGYGEEVL